MLELDVGYKDYYRSGYYDLRYPSYNPRSLKIIISNIGKSGKILDFGCGNGRYTLPILKNTLFDILGYDICEEAIDQLKSRVRQEPLKNRLSLLCGLPEFLKEYAPFDAAIAMFGVISHIKGRTNRIKAIKYIYDLLKPNNSKIILSVPNASRRFYLKQLEYKLLKVKIGCSSLEDNDIIYQRTTNNKRIHLYYHLYTRAELEEDLKLAGFSTLCISPESIFPEAWVTSSSKVSYIDEKLSSIAPCWMGYGIIAVGNRS